MALLYCCNVVSAQESANEHIVVKGDNVYRLSLRYNVTMESIFKSNPGSRSLIKIGELLNIPEQTNNINSYPPSPTSSTYNFKNHEVLKGETKYALSKLYNCSIADLEKVNPQIVAMLLAGTIIKIPDNASTQNNTLNNNRSKENTHIVTKGETLWSISQRYGLPLAELKELNPQKTSNIINVGEVLNVNSPSEDKSMYIVIKGDTKFGLSKRFNVTIDWLEQMNPSIVPMLKSGTTIRVSDTNTISTAAINTAKIETSQNTRNDTYRERVNDTIANKRTNTTFTIVDYIIKPKETLYGLSKQANMSIDQFLTLNPSLENGVTKGSLIRMPVATNTIIQNTTPKQSPHTSNTYNVSILWEDNTEISNTEATKKKTNYFIGLKKAVDSVSLLYPHNSIKINELKTIDSLSDYSKHITLFAADSLGKKLVDDPNIDFIALDYYDENTTNNKILIKSKPTAIDQRDSVLSYLKQQNQNIICIYDQDHTENIETIQTIFPEAHFISTKKNGSFKSSNLKKVLQSNSNNAVIIESNKVGVYLSTTNILLKEISDEKSIQLVALNYENIPSENNITMKRFSILKLLYPATHHTDESSSIDLDTAYGFAFNYDLFNRLFSKGVQGIDNQTTSKFGYSFNYDFKDNMYKNKAVKLLVFGKDGKRFEVNKNR